MLLQKGQGQHKGNETGCVRPVNTADGLGECRLVGSTLAALGPAAAGRVIWRHGRSFGSGAPPQDRPVQAGRQSEAARCQAW